MELSNPTHFKDLFEMITSIITGLVALIGVYYGVQTFLLAKEAKEEWIKEKKFDYKVIVDSLLSDYLTVINDVYDYKYNYTHVFLRGDGAFEYKGSVVEAISKSKEYVDKAIKYVNHSIYSKATHGEKLNQIYEKLHPAVVGLNERKLKEIFYNIEEFKRQYDWQVENSRKMIAFLISCYKQEGSINNPSVNKILENTVDYIANGDYEKDLKNIRLSIKDYLITQSGAD